ncbi:tetratricopeptide repeat protein [Actinomadura sp. NPDC000929]|uniref:tetratricopeptide repeat protein n=1 Tax=Actinomadura sp. NPDC000929 TaxID=3154517 RepID=UPI0033934E34
MGGNVYGPNIQIGSTAGPIMVAWEQPEFRLELLTPQFRRIPRSQRLPSHMLDVHRLVVPYRPRPDAEAMLEHWLKDNEPVSLRLIPGPGGVGKTRLGYWSATLTHEQGWTVLGAADASRPLREPTRQAEMPASGNVLVVVDYAERWPLKALTRMVEMLTTRYDSLHPAHDAHKAGDNAHVERLRVLLLARPQAGFWKDASAALGRVSVDLADPLPLEEFVASLDDLAEAFNEAAAAFQRELQIQVQSVPQPAGLQVDRNVSPLMVHMAALAAVCATDEGAPIPHSEDLSAYLLQHERRYWQCSPAGSEAMARAVLIATLFGPIWQPARARAWMRRARLADGDAAADQLLTIHERLYPSTETRPPHHPQGTTHGSDAGGVSALAPLKPDRFAEDFLADELGHQRTQALVTELVTDEQTTAREARQALLMLAAAGGRHHTARQTLFAVLRSTPIRPGWLSPPLVTTVLDHAPYDLAATVENAIPIHHTDLLSLARDLAQRLHQEQPSEATPAQRAHRLNNLGGRLWEMGEHRAGLERFREAAEIRRKLVEVEPAVYLPDLAHVLNNLGKCLSGVGDMRAGLEPVREAIGIYRRLAQAEPAVYLADLADALNNLGSCLSELGEHRAGLDPFREAAEIRRKLVEAEPAAYLPRLAGVLNNLGKCLSEMGENRAGLEPVREAIEIYCKLAEAEPAVYLADLAGALNNLGVSLSGVGEQRAGLEPFREAVEIRRKLVEAEPAAYLPGLAWALNNLGNCLSELGDMRAGLEPVCEAVGIYRRLAEAEPAVFLPGLADALNNLGNCLSGVGEQRAGLEPFREAVGTCRKLVEAEPAAYLPKLALSLTNLGGCLSGVGEQRAGLEPVREAVGIYRELAEAEPAAYLPMLAMSLTNLGGCLSGVGDMRAALKSVREAVGIYRKLVEAEPAVYLADLAGALNNLGVSLSGVGEQRAALEPFREAVDIRRKLAAAHPAAYLPGLAGALNNLGNRLLRVGGAACWAGAILRGGRDMSEAGRG